MTKDEALKLALEALQHEADIGNDDAYKLERDAIKEALAQPEQERFLVATIGNWGRVEWVDGVFPSLGDKMYSAPRTWVGLTDEEVRDLWSWSATSAAEKTANTQQHAFARAIEAKLKEKNSG